MILISVVSSIAFHPEQTSKNDCVKLVTASLNKLYLEAGQQPGLTQPKKIKKRKMSLICVVSSIAFHPQQASKNDCLKLVTAGKTNGISRGWPAARPDAA